MKLGVAPHVGEMVGGVAMLDGAKVSRGCGCSPARAKARRATAASKSNETNESKATEAQRRKALRSALARLAFVHGRCAKSPNDRKLSDGGAWRGSRKGGAQKETTNGGQSHDRMGRAQARMAATVTRGTVRCSAWLGVAVIADVVRTAVPFRVAWVAGRTCDPPQSWQGRPKRC